MLLAVVGGMNELNRSIRNWGFSKTHYYNWLPDLDGTNITSPAEIGKMLYNIDNPEFLSLKSRAEIVEIMGHVKNRYLINSGLPWDVQFLHKTGDIGSMLGDAGVVIFPDGRKYIIAIMVTRPWNDYSAKQFIVEASETAYRSISKGRF
jgi:beta-lactamase class A